MNTSKTLRLPTFAALAVFVTASAVAQQLIPVTGEIDLRLRNRSEFDAVTASVRYDAVGHTAAAAPDITLEAGQEIVLHDVIATRFALTDDTSGEISVVAADSIDVSWRRARAGSLAVWRPAVAAVASPAGRRRAVGHPVATTPVAPPVVEPLTLVRVGDTTTFSGSHRVSGQAEIISRNVIRLSNLRHDGSAPGLDIRVGLSTMARKSFVVLRVTGRQAFNDAIIDVTLPDNVDLNSFNTLTIWCYEFNTVIAEGQFHR